MIDTPQARAMPFCSRHHCEEVLNRSYYEYTKAHELMMSDPDNFSKYQEMADKAKERFERYERILGLNL